MRSDGWSTGVNIVALGGWAYPSSSFSSILSSWGTDHAVVCKNFDQPLDGIAKQPDLIIGWSLGGLRVLEAVANGIIQPKRVVLISSTARFCTTEGYDSGVTRVGLRSMMAGLKRNRTNTLAAFYRDAFYPANSVDNEIERRINDAGIFSDAALAQGLRWLDELDVRQTLPELTTSTLILHGEKDRLIPVGAAKFLSRQLPHAVIHVHPEAGHEMLLRDVHWIADRLREFLP